MAGILIIAFFNSNVFLLLGLFRLQQLFDVILISETDLEIKVFEVAPSSTVVYEQLAAMDESYQDEKKPVLLDLSYDIIGEVLTKQERDPWRLNFHYIPVGLVSKMKIVCDCALCPVTTKPVSMVYI